VVSLVLTHIDYCNSVLSGLPSSQLNRLQAVINDAARLILSGRRCDHITPLLVQLHWLRVPERIEYKLCVLVYRCLHGMAPDYLSSRFHRVLCYDSATSAFGGNITTDRTRHLLFNTWRSGIPCYRCTRLERSSAPCTDSAYFWPTFTNTPNHLFHRSFCHSPVSF